MIFPSWYHGSETRIWIKGVCDTDVATPSIQVRGPTILDPVESVFTINVGASAECVGKLHRS